MHRPLPFRRCPSRRYRCLPCKLPPNMPDRVRTLCRTHRNAARCSRRWCKRRYKPGWALHTDRSAASRSAPWMNKPPRATDRPRNRLKMPREMASAGARRTVAWRLSPWGARGENGSRTQSRGAHERLHANGPGPVMHQRRDSISISYIDTQKSSEPDTQRRQNVSARVARATLARYFRLQSERTTLVVLVCGKWSHGDKAFQRLRVRAQRPGASDGFVNEQ